MNISWRLGFTLTRPPVNDHVTPSYVSFELSRLLLAQLDKIGELHRIALPPDIIPSITGDDEQCYRQSRRPTKGIGMFARHDIRRGQRILAESPLLDILLDIGSEGLDATAIDIAVSTLNEQDWTRFKSLSSAFEGSQLVGDSRSRGSPLVCRIQTNSFEAEVDGRKHAYLFDKTSRFNHSCKPNISFYHNPLTQLRAVYATRDIKAGEELCVTYLAKTYVPYSQRQADLLERYNFTCMCEVCSASKAERVQFDKERVDVTVLLHRLSGIRFQGMQWQQGRTFLNDGRRAIDLITSCGLHSSKTEVVYDRMADIALFFADKPRAIVFCRRMIEVKMHRYGLDDVTLPRACSALEDGLLEEPKNQHYNAKDPYPARRRISSRMLPLRSLKNGCGIRWRSCGVTCRNWSRTLKRTQVIDNTASDIY